MYFFDGNRADRDALKPEHFSKWVEFAKARNIGIDFNPTFFSHPMVKDNLTLSSPDEEVRAFWVRHAIACLKIAEYFAKETKCLGLITGESIGQVASQTMQSLAATNEACTLPVYRPLIAMDKQDIVTIAEKIDTYETSILPYEDCCTIFVAKHPVTKPNVEFIRKSELKLAEKIDELMETAITTTETIMVEAE